VNTTQAEGFPMFASIMAEDLAKKSTQIEEEPKDFRAITILLLVLLTLFTIILLLCVALQKVLMKRKDQINQEKLQRKTESSGEPGLLEMPHLHLLNSDLNQSELEETQIADQETSS